MKDKLSTQGSRIRSPLYLAMIVMLSGAGAAGAADLTPAVRDQLATFKNIRVVNAPELAAPAPKTEAGLKAYKDAETGGLRGPTQADVIAESQSGQGFAAAQQAAEPIQYVTENGAVGMDLGDSQMVFAVVKKDESGALHEYCVVGSEEASKILNSKAPLPSPLKKKEIRNDR